MLRSADAGVAENIEIVKHSKPCATERSDQFERLSARKLRVAMTRSCVAVIVTCQSGLANFSGRRENPRRYRADVGVIPSHTSHSPNNCPSAAATADRGESEFTNTPSPASVTE